MVAEACNSSIQKTEAQQQVILAHISSSRIYESLSQKLNKNYNLKVHRVDSLSKKKNPEILSISQKITQYKSQ